MKDFLKGLLRGFLVKGLLVVSVLVAVPFSSSLFLLCCGIAALIVMRKGLVSEK